jgi:alpha-beta hydrolase superfamily lysophospholipase
MFGLILKISAGLLLIGFLVLWLDHRSETTLPAPTGPFAVGRSIQDWREPNRELLAWIWYPTDANAPFDAYLPPTILSGLERHEPAIIHFLMRDLSKVHGHSIQESAVSQKQASYPVVVFRGGASAGVNRYSVLAEDLASQGYVVVGIDDPVITGVAFPDGRVTPSLPENNIELCPSGGETESACVNRLLHAWTSDIVFAVDHLAQLNGSDPSARFTGHLDMTRLGLFGHSFGGAQAAEFCHDDPRCKAAIDLDGLVFANFAREGTRQPFMFVFTEQINSKGDELRRDRAQFDQVFNRLPSTTRARFVIRGSNHFFFSEEQALLTSHVLIGVLRHLHVIGIDGARQIAATEYLVHTFFDTWLKGIHDSGLAAPGATFPEIEAVRSK